MSPRHPKSGLWGSLWAPGADSKSLVCAPGATEVASMLHVAYKFLFAWDNGKCSNFIEQAPDSVKLAIGNICSACRGAVRIVSSIPLDCNSSAEDSAFWLPQIQIYMAKAKRNSDRSEVIGRMGGINQPGK